MKNRTDITEKMINLIRPEIKIAFNLIPKLDLIEKRNWINILEDHTTETLKFMLDNCVDGSYSISSLAAAIAQNKKIELKRVYGR